MTTEQEKHAIVISTIFSCAMMVPKKGPADRLASPSRLRLQLAGNVRKQTRFSANRNSIHGGGTQQINRGAGSNDEEGIGT